jgi:hypothetical protein
MKRLKETKMNKERKQEILEGIGRALDEVEYGQITIELRGPCKAMDLVIQKRVRFQGSQDQKQPIPTPLKPGGYKKG